MDRARALLPDPLGRELCVDPRELVVAVGAHGKPYIAGIDTVRFSVADCEDVAIIAVARDREVGVDVERVRPMTAAHRIARRRLSPADLARPRRPQARATGPSHRDGPRGNR